MRLLAWITEIRGKYKACIVSDDSIGYRRPATKRFPTRDEAEQWIRTEAAKLDLPLEWLP